jgi:glycosyltransferase involved in cell wall biosynthesis
MDASVIIPAFQHAAYIRQALESVLAQQTSYRYEVLICDDASTDGTDSIMSNLLHQLDHPKHVTYRRNDRNLGMMGNLRQAFEWASGRYLFFCEGDDYWMSTDKIHRQVQLLDDRPDIMLSMHEGEVLWPDGSKTLATGFDHDKVMSVPELVADPSVTASFAYRKELTAPMPCWFDHLLAFDRALKITAADRGVVHFSSELKSAYRKHPGGYWTGKSHRNMILSSCINLKMIDRGTKGRHSQALRYRIQSRMNGLRKQLTPVDRIRLEMEWLWKTLRI